MTIESEHHSSQSLIALSQDRLKYLLDYDPDTGVFVWANPNSNSVRIGEEAGSHDNDTGYIEICVDSIVYKAHHPAWFYVYSEWPNRIDHKDTCRANNRINNLRKATRSQNAANQSVRITNLLGIKGVQRRGNRYRAYITVNYKTLHLGTFDTLGEAKDARREAAIKYFGEFANED